MVESDYQVYVGIDWASEAHQACVLDHERRAVAERSFAHTGSAVTLPLGPGFGCTAMMRRRQPVLDGPSYLLCSKDLASTRSGVLKPSVYESYNSARMRRAWFLLSF